MEKYKNLGSNSGVSAYEIGDDFIKVEFSSGMVYLYTKEITGIHDIERMKELAIAGKGLNSYISKYVKKRYASKLR